MPRVWLEDDVAALQHGFEQLAREQRAAMVIARENAQDKADTFRYFDGPKDMPHELQKERAMFWSGVAEGLAQALRIADGREA